MKKKLFFGAVFFLAFGGGIGLGWYIRNQTLNPKATIPNILERILSKTAEYSREGFTIFPVNHKIK